MKTAPWFVDSCLQETKSKTPQFREALIVDDLKLQFFGINSNE